MLQKMFLFRHATFAWRDTFLLDPRFPRVLSFLFWWRSAARLQTLRRFLGSPTGITAASFLDLLMLLYGLHHSWVGFSVRRFLAGGRLFSAILQVHQSFVKYGPHFRLTIRNFFPHFL
jgi:hypothetical protein